MAQSAGREAGRQARFLLPSLATKSTCKLTVPGRAYFLDVAAADSNRVALVAGAAPAVRSAGARAHLFSNEPAVHHAALEACTGATGGAAVPVAAVGGAAESAQLAGHHGDDLLNIGVEARHDRAIEDEVRTRNRHAIRCGRCRGASVVNKVIDGGRGGRGTEIPVVSFAAGTKHHTDCRKSWNCRGTSLRHRPN